MFCSFPHQHSEDIRDLQKTRDFVAFYLKYRQKAQLVGVGSLFDRVHSTVCF